ncbi:hypothetical protein J3458_003403 [Metarhizium acridum]|uniref:uncharacterized protein n=1 Tax=Metarhizium acridum TaxID=92637 RepID=UPI001C6C5638|nr:hypothetical protein J3458_003403 [Metarhizium acridum]
MYDFRDKTGRSACSRTDLSSIVLGEGAYDFLYSPPLLQSTGYDISPRFFLFLLHQLPWKASPLPYLPLALELHLACLSNPRPTYPLPVLWIQSLIPATYVIATP